jgi:restriction system protein
MSKRLFEWRKLMNQKTYSRSKTLAIKLIFSAFSILEESGKEMHGKDLINLLEKKVELDEWAKERYEKSGYIRWQSLLHFFSIDSVKSGFIIKKKGIWYLTPEGEEALKLGPEKLFEEASKGYKKWKAEQPVLSEEEIEESPTTEEVMEIDDVEQRALEGLERYINSQNAYEFQDLVAALLRAMGYYTPFVAPKGKDGGVDIVAYRDPLGTQSPRIQVQIKHREAAAKATEMRQLMGLLQKEGDVGIFVSTNGFTPDAKQAAKISHIHIELIDLNRFISLWQEFYEKMSDEDKTLLPLRPIYFLAIKA